MRYFQKALRRAEIDVKFSEGMSPHMIMSFASPLGVGLTSRGEYVDIELRTPIPTRRALDQLNRVMVEGMEILDFRRVPDGKASKAMSLVAAADYTVTFRKGYVPQGDWQSDISGFFARKTIPVVKETKKGEKEIDIRPMIYEMKVNGGVVFLKLAAGSEANLKPDLVMEEYQRWKGYEIRPFALEINREELYADLGREGDHRFVSLNDLGDTVTEEDLLSERSKDERPNEGQEKGKEA